ncbi:hypothetical protein [Klebsiella pneumoniae]|uniref:hypothetical protein n=1 Tax=Klebsiella pneumoniae TaxID=573 RepID=UPI002245D7AE|nr:hypothetical protein [Klebsiella pneumoniae]MCW9304128.1 hypothetical protein [Klebsiella pneumoniae]
MTTDITILVQRLKVAAKNGCCHTLFPDDCLALVGALEKAQQRISRLESRSVKLPKAMSIEGGAYCSAHAHYDSDGDYYDRAEVEEMLAAAGIKVEAE